MPLNSPTSFLERTRRHVTGRSTVTKVSDDTNHASESIVIITQVSDIWGRVSTDCAAVSRIINEDYTMVLIRSMNASSSGNAPFLREPRWPGVQPERYQTTYDLLHLFLSILLDKGSTKSCSSCRHRSTFRGCSQIRECKV